MKRTLPMLSRAMAVVAICTFSSIQLAQADWSDNFDGGLQQSWLFGSVDGGGNPSATFSAVSSNDQLVLSDTMSAATGGAGAGFGVVLDPLSDLRMTGTINPSGDAGISGTVTLLARGNLASGQLYAAEVDYASSELFIFRNDNLTTTTNIADATIPGLSTDDSLYMVFDLIGSSLTASVYDAPGGTLLQSVSATDSTYATGLAGVLVAADDVFTPMLGVWDNVTASTIPEPSTALIAVTMFSTALAMGRRRQR